MNKKFLRGILLAGLVITANGVLSAAPAKTEWNGANIVCGDKKITCLPDSTVRISNASGALVKFVSECYIKELSSKKTDWGGFSSSRKVCKMVRTKNGYQWELTRSAFGKTWNAATQTLEIQPDGQLLLKIAYHKIPDGLELVSKYHSMNISGTVFEGKKFTYCGQEKVFNPKVKAAGYGKQDHVYQLNIGSGKMTFTGKTGKVNYPVFLYFPRQKTYEVRWVVTKDSSIELLIDLRDCGK